MSQFYESGLMPLPSSTCLVAVPLLCLFSNRVTIAPLTSTTAPAATASAPAGGNATAVVMEVLASKTGYDVDMIEDDMELETELGIDSIKRVEILSEVQSRLGVEAKDVAALSRTRTVGEVISAMAKEMGGASPFSGPSILRNSKQWSNFCQSHCSGHGGACLEDWLRC